MSPAGPWHYPEDQISDAPLRALAAEITREKLFDRLHEELPYQATVETEAWKELRDGSVRIEQTIYVERESQRKIVLGKGGATIKAIGAEARKEIAELIEQPVHLFLFVKVREGWGDDPERYREHGAGVSEGVTAASIRSCCRRDTNRPGSAFRLGHRGARHHHAQPADFVGRLHCPHARAHGTRRSCRPTSPMSKT